jgi:RNA polymerase sigma-70 factor (ECF subfamily)
VSQIIKAFTVVGSWDQNERKIILRAQKGDVGAFELLVERHGKLVYNLALRMLRDAHEAENLAQEAFLRAWRGLPGFQMQAKFSTWLYQIVTNLCYTRLPALQRELANQVPDEDLANLPDDRQSVENVILTDEWRSLIYAAIDNLPDTYRLLINLRHLQMMSYEEIAEVTGMPLGTVKTGIFRARQLLRKTLVMEGFHDG